MDKTPKELRGTKRHRKPPKRKTDYKKAVKLEQGLVVARLKGEDQWKKTKKGMYRELLNHFGKAVDRIDPMETVATIGLTILIKQLIDTSEDIRGQIKSIGGLYGEYYLFGQRGTWLRIVANVIGLKEADAEKYEGFFPDYMDWLIAFTLAYIIIRHGGSLFGLMKEGMGTLKIVIMALLGLPYA